jgi:hypothetical protein
MMCPGWEWYPVTPSNCCLTTRSIWQSILLAILELFKAEYIAEQPEKNINQAMNSYSIKGWSKELHMPGWATSLTILDTNSAFCAAPLGPTAAPCETTTCPKSEPNATCQSWVNYASFLHVWSCLKSPLRCQKAYKSSAGRPTRLNTTQLNPTRHAIPSQLKSIQLISAR